MLVTGAGVAAADAAAYDLDLMAKARNMPRVGLVKGANNLDRLQSRV